MRPECRAEGWRDQGATRNFATNFATNFASALSPYTRCGMSVSADAIQTEWYLRRCAGLQERLHDVLVTFLSSIVQGSLEERGVISES